MSKSAYPDLIDALSSINSIGFTTLQAAAYIAALQLGEETGSAIANASGINRSKIYDILNQLEELGAISKISRENKPRYIAVSPESLFPKLLSKFQAHLNQSKDRLKVLAEDRVEIDTARMTITKLNLRKLDLNDFEYFVSSNERARTELIDIVNKENRPSKRVKLLELNWDNPEGLILLVSNEVTYLLPTPDGRTVDSLQFNDPIVSKFFKAIIESWWTKDIPVNVQKEIKDGTLRALYVGKSVNMNFQMQGGREYKYDRPVSFSVTDKHLTFYYLGTPDPVIPLLALSQVKLLDEHELECTFTTPEGKEFGKLYFQMVGQAQLMKNLLDVLSPKIQ